jgi:hypothetical protein
MLAGASTTGVALQEQPVFAHQTIDPLGIHMLLAGRSPLALEERGDPPIAVGRPLVDESTNIGGQFHIARPYLRSP